jgi:hypothetical protein
MLDMVTVKQSQTPLRHDRPEPEFAVDHANRNLVSEFPLQFRVGVNVYLTPLKVSLSLNLHERVLNNLAEMTILTGIHHNIVHIAIVIVPVCLGRISLEQLAELGKRLLAGVNQLTGRKRDRSSSLRTPRHFHVDRNVVLDRHRQERWWVNFEIGQGCWNCS